MKWWKKVIDIVDDVFAYLCTMVGVLASAYLPALRSGEDIIMKISWWKLALAAVVALMIVAQQEMITPDETGSVSKNREARRKNAWKRIFNSLSQGMMWNQLLNLL